MMLTHSRTLLRHPTLLRSYEQIFLLSHMRANTSLLGHILGANPEIEGYYEMHIGYHSWRSRWRQKLLYFAKHTPKRGGRFMFDKLLHNDHAIAPMFLQSSKIIFSLRPPEMTVPSIVSLYQKVEPGHEHCEPDAAFAYYCDRLRELARLAEQTPRYCYLDAQALRERGDEVLSELSDWLGLKSPLASDYDVQPLTGRGNTGDHSEHLKTGRVLKSTSDYSHVPLDPATLALAQELYRDTRKKLIASCNLSIV